MGGLKKIREMGIRGGKKPSGINRSALSTENVTYSIPTIRKGSHTRPGTNPAEKRSLEVSLWHILGNTGG